MNRLKVALALPTAVGLFMAAAPAMSAVVAADDFNAYTLGVLSGQAASGTGFAGNWYQILNSGQSIVAQGVVGRPNNNNSQSGDAVNFATPISLTTGQLYIGYSVRNLTNSGFNGTRLDLNGPLGRTYLGGLDLNSNFNFYSDFGGGPAQTSISTVGSHRVVGVLDKSNDKIAIFVNPTAASFYNADGSNNADGSSAWTTAGPVTFGSYSLIQNLSDSVEYDDVVFSTTFAAAAGPVPEPVTWAMMVLGFGAVGAAMRQRQGAVA